VGAKHDRFTGKDWFHRILPAVSCETFTHEHHSSYAIPPLKFTSCIEEDAIGISPTSWQRFAGEGDTQWKNTQICTDFLQPFNVSRRDEQTQGWKLLAQTQKNSGQHFFFAAMRAAAKEDE
jgi:hypothetical protein